MKPAALLLLVCFSSAYALSEEQVVYRYIREQTNDALETEEATAAAPVENEATRTVEVVEKKVDAATSAVSETTPAVAVTEDIAGIIRDVLRNSLEDSQSVIDAAVKSAAMQIADQVQERMEQRLKRIEAQAEENLLKYNGIAMFMVEKFYLKADQVERRIAKSLDLITEIVQYRLSTMEQNMNNQSMDNTSLIPREPLDFDCLGYKKLALMKVRYGKYYISENMTDWYGAKWFCKTHGMELVSFERASEMRAIWQIADASKEFMVSYWTSASDIGHERGQFHWRDGQKIESELWITGYPEAPPGEQEQSSCVSLFIGRLRATSCNYQRYFICEGLKHDNKATFLNQKINGE
ncbi:uncharacterized protein LOC135946445 [Cloeon dipterum]|uniref:C-type lectin domain-containing protein n=1 Tax=Cloeon dipterum TaxID=197152 RepID=A0A8S1C6W8_9INSE|nr:Hypothetical predicted protein [Cloeon dipterum]